MQCYEYSDDQNYIDNAGDPLWKNKVNERGELFYLEANDPVEYISATSSVHRHPYNGAIVHHPFHEQHSYHINGKNNDRLDLSCHYPSDAGTNLKISSKRIKKKMKGFLGKGSNSRQESKLTDSQLNRHNLTSSGHGVTFNDVPTGVMKEVTIFVDPFRHNYGRRATQAENLFGIIPGHFGSPSHDSDERARDRRIMVQGLVPNAEAMKANVKIGEWLMCVNDLEVNFDNIDSILSGITGPRFIKLTLQKIAIQTSPKQILVKKKHVINDELVKVVSGERLKLSRMSLDNVPHCLMFLSLECKSDSMQDKEEILYQYPAFDSKLVAIRGLFITLTQMLLDVTNNIAKSTSIVINDSLIYVGYYKENREVLVFCLPAEKVSLCHLSQLLEDVVRLLKILYGSLHSAFSNQKNQTQLNHFFTLLFHKVLLGHQIFQNGHKHTAETLGSFYNLLPAVRTLTLPEETKVTVNNCLSTFEAADFADMSDDFYDLRRLFTILGSCLFYKGYLIASHLHKEDLLDIYLYLHHYCVLTLSNEEQLGQVVLWKEVFPTRRCHKQVDPILPGYSEPEARWFLMVVGMKNMLMGVLLEAGGCSSWADGNPGPDAFYVDQTKATLLQLESLDIINCCETRLQSPAIPSLASIDWVFAASKSQKMNKDSSDPISNKPQSSPRPVAPGLKRSSLSSKEPESILKKGGQGDIRQKGRGAVYDMDSDIDSHSTNSDNSTPKLNKFWSSQVSDDSLGSGSGSSGLFKGNKRRRNLMYAYDMSGMKRSLDGEDGGGSLVKITSGHSNTLFQYVHIDTIDGVFVCPCQQELSEIKGTLHKQLLCNFQQACVSIRAVLHQSRRRQEWIRNGSLGKFGPNDSLGIVREHGVLFECDAVHNPDSKKLQTASYWVVGRIFDEPYPREVYVCFLDTAQQNSVEMAFKLGFGLSLL